MWQIMNKFGFVLLLLSVSMVEQTEGKGYEKPLNCGHLECAPYRVIQSRPEFEIRSYSKAMWVATSPITSSSYKDAVSKGFKILLAYIRGNNEGAVKMNMTAPVLVNIHPKTGGLHNLTYVVHFYMPQIFQRNPPRSAEAHPVELPRNKFAAVRRFGGFMDDSNISAQISALKKSLKGTAWESNKRSGSGSGGGSRSLLYSAAGYNSPFEYENRVNEVMLWFN
ncbi:cytosolic heme (tetrapyrrole) binding protein 1, haem-binding protein 1 [Hibiscus trionum]|nr:cytosolic heme (tetrapyrrole) binding protein 1, haem-binding protein 1 [Hibiscus trionum]